MDDDEKELFLEKSFCLLGLFTEFLFSQWQRQGSNPWPRSISTAGPMIFSSFSQYSYKYSTKDYKWKKCWWCAWDSNPGPHEF